VVWNESEDSEVTESGSLDILEYARSHAGDGSSLGYNSCEGFDAYEYGEYIALFREHNRPSPPFLSQDSFAPHIASGWMSEASQKELETGLTMTWDGSGQLFIGPCMEAFILQWTLEKLKPMEEGLYYFSINYEEIAD